MQEHDSRLEQVFRAIHKAGLKLNKEKCKFRQETLDYLGHKFSSQGMSPSPDKIKAISEMKAPSDVTELRRYLGMVNYLGGYIPNLSQIEQPLNELLKKESVWTWGEKQRNAFAEIKKLLTTAPTLAYYDPVKPVTVSADASGYGIGAVLLQGTKTDVHPVAYASRTMTQSEQRYAQIEKECLAATWACEKFHRYLFGLEKFRLITDHKPLVPIINSEDLNKVPLRCQRLLMRLMKYNAQAEFAPGKTLQVADTLSRQPLEETESESINSEDIHEVYLQEEVVRTSWPVSDDKLEDIRQETEIDPKLRDAIKLTLQGWPKLRQEIPTHIKNWHEHRIHFSVAHRLLLYDNKIVIPDSMKAEMLTRIHMGHQGTNKCRERADSCVWWLGITRDIKEYVEQCEHCQIHRNAQRREPLCSTPMPEGPWEKIAADLFMFDGQMYLFMTDYYSRYPEVIFLQDTTSKGVICKMNKAYRPNAHLLYIVMHYNGNIMVIMTFTFTLLF